MYALTLWVHSWLRWLVVAAALVVFAYGLRGWRRRSPWTGTDERWTKLLLGLVNLQFLLGLLLYVLLSPIVRAAVRDPGAAMKSSVLRFFAIEHITAMVIAVAVAHAGLARARRLGAAPERHRRAAIVVGLFLLCVVIGIPWPFRPYGRPLARVSLVAPEPVAVPDLYAARCAVCHGPAGRGDGVAAGAMQPPPRDLGSPSFQRSVSDAQLAEVIAKGGAARGLSTNMPPNPDLDAREIELLVRFVRAAGAGVKE